MAYKFLDSVGLSYTFQKIKALLNGKADSNHTHKYAGSASVGGAANSATKLETSRTINGVAFDGTENINIDVGVKSINGSTGAVTLKDYVTGLSVSGKTITYTKKDGTSGTITTQDTTYSEATTSANGLMSKADKSKLDGIASGANAYTHPNSGVTAGTYKSVTVNAQGHVTGGSNPTTLAGYGISNAYTKTEVDTKLADLVDSAPETLDTLNELSAALGDDPNFATTIANQIGLKANTADLATVATSGSYADLTNKPTIPSAYTLPTATSSVLGGVKVGSNITVSSGTISLTKANVTAALGYTPPTTNTTYSAATTSDNGLMSSTDKAKLDAITASADSVSFTRSLTSGTKVGTITINGTGTDIYCESGVEVEALTTEELDEILV